MEQQQYGSCRGRHYRNSYGISIGAATISYSVTSGCGSATAVRSVTVNSISAGTVTGITTLCVGGTSALGSTVIGGVWTTVRLRLLQLAAVQEL